MILNISCYWDSSQNGKPFVNSTIPVNQDLKLYDIIKNEVTQKNPMLVFSDLTIKSAKSFNGRDVIKILDLPAAQFMNAILNENPKELIVVLQQSTTSVTATPTKKNDALQYLMRNAAPSKQKYVSKFKHADVVNFLDGLERASNRENYLKSFTKETKPSIVDQVQSIVVKFLNDSGIYFKGGTGGEEESAKEGLSAAVTAFQFIHESRKTLARQQAQRFQTKILQDLLHLNVQRVKVCQGKKPNLTKAIIVDELSKADACLKKQPKSWFKKKDNGERVGEEILSELENIVRILGAHLDHMNHKDDTNRQNYNKTSTQAACSSNTETSIIPPKLTKNKRKSSKKWTDEDKIIYKHIDKLEKDMKNANPYTPFCLTDDKMGISLVTESLVNAKSKSRLRRKFMKQIQFKFRVGVFKYKRNGTLSDWVVICKMGARDDKSCEAFLGFVQDAQLEAPAYLSKRQTQDAVNSISLATGKNKLLCDAILSAILPCGLIPTFDLKKDKEAFLSNVTKYILEADGSTEMDIITDMRYFNCRGNNTQSLFETFFEEAHSVIESENGGSAAHIRRHAAADIESTNCVAYAPGIVSIHQLIQKTIRSLEQRNLVRDIDFKVPSHSWMHLQLTPTNDYHVTSMRLTSRLPFIRVLQSRSSRDDHPCGHWVSAMKKYWRHYYAMLFKLIAEYTTNDKEDFIEPCLEPRVALCVTGCDDKTSIPIGRKTPISAIGNQSSRAIVSSETVPEAADHDWHCERLTPSVIHRMNISEDPSDSLYSGGTDGNGKTFVSIHNQTLDPSSGIKHTAHFYEYLCHEANSETHNSSSNNDSTKSSFPYSVLIEADGGPDHNLTFLSNKIALLGLFLIGNMDKLTATRGCPGLSYLNTAERAMANLNIGLSCLSLSLDPNMDKWLYDNILKSATTMKATRKNILEYDEEKQIAIDILERRCQKQGNVSIPEENDSDDVLVSSSTNDVAVTTKVGDTVRRFFRGFGWFTGEVTSINMTAENNKFIHMEYEDGDGEDITQEQMILYESEAKVKIGDVGFQFIKKFGGVPFTGKVESIKKNGKRLCVFCDGDKHEYTIEQLEKYSKLQVQQSESEDSASDGSHSLSSSDNEEGANTMLESEIDDVVDSASSVNEVVHTSTTNAVNGKFVKTLIVIPQGKTVSEHLFDLKNQKSAHDSFTSAMELPKKIVEKRFSALELDTRKVEVLPYAKNDDVNKLTTALKSFDKDFHISYTKKSDLSKMSKIESILNCPKHCRCTPFTFELRLCGIENCALCRDIGRTPRTPNATVNGYNLRDEVLRFLDLPIKNPADKDHYLSPESCRKYIDERKLSFDDIKQFIPSSKTDTENSLRMNKAKKKDKLHAPFKPSEVRATVSCDHCGAVRCIYSKHMVGSSRGPSTEKLDELKRWLESNGYVCGDKVKSFGRNFYGQRALVCGTPIEYQYYNPTSGTKGGRIITNDICSICYDSCENGNKVSPDEIVKERDVGGKSPLMVCSYCFDSKAPIAYSGGRRTNMRQKKQQEERTKRKQMEDACTTYKALVQRKDSGIDVMAGDGFCYDPDCGDEAAQTVFNCYIDEWWPRPDSPMTCEKDNFGSTDAYGAWSYTTGLPGFGEGPCHQFTYWNNGQGLPDKNRISNPYAFLDHLASKGVDVSAGYEAVAPDYADISRVE